MKTLAFLLVLLAQAPQAAPPAGLRATLMQLRAQLSEHQATYGAAAELTAAKHQLLDWFESRLAGLGERGDAAAFAETLSTALAGAGLFCSDFQFECRSNLLGYVDEIRISRAGEFLVAVTATGISCGYDESAYVYAWAGQRWRRVWEHERNTYTRQDYLPQTIHDVQISSPDASRGRLLMTLGSQTTCGGAFKDIYARAWQLDADYRSAAVLDSTTARANDGYPPVQGRVLPDDVLFEFWAGGILSGEGHAAFRHFKIQNGTAIQVDPIAPRPRDFVVEWLSTPWVESRARSESASLETWHAQLYRNDGVGDFPDPTLRCTIGSDFWQVRTNLFEGPKRYYLVRWRSPFSFTMVDVSETPFPGCTVADSRSETYPNLLESDLK